jgi:hypothetical protein
MRWRLRAAMLAAVAWIRRLNQRPNDPEHDRNKSNKKKAPTSHRQEPESSSLLKAEWSAPQTLVREMHENEKQHQAAENKTWAAQLRAAKGLNRITGIGAIAGLLGLMGVAASVIIAKRAADDGHTAADAAKQSADIAAAGNRAWLGPIKVSLHGEISATRPITLVVQYHNIGREPAVDVRMHYNIKTYDASIDLPTNFAVIEQDNVCNSVAKQEGGNVAWPQIDGGYTLNLDSE